MPTLEDYKTKIALGYMEEHFAELSDIAYKYLPKDELEHFEELIKEVD